MSKPKMIGTVLPDARTYELADKYAKSVASKQDRIAKKSLKGLRKVYKEGEWRYYDGDSKYAVVSHKTFEVLWFSVHHDSDGEYSMRIKK